MISLEIRRESWPVAGGFTISRGTVQAVELVVVELVESGPHGTFRGRGECRPYARYGETPEGVIEAIEAQRHALNRGLDRAGLQEALPAGAARNALDCALWDLAAKRAEAPLWQLLALAPPQPLLTAYTLSLDRPEAMAANARRNAARPLLKIKLGGEDDLACVEAVRAAAPRARLILDANEGWSIDDYRRLVPPLAELGVDLIEQPLAAGEDGALAELPRPIVLCADESCHDSASLAGLEGLYDAVNIKLDKTGGLSEALNLRARAEEAGYIVMVGSMLATSLAMAPAVLLAQGAAYVDLDGPLLLERDRSPGLRYEGGLLHPPEGALWG
jgi:L-alanine-DL-glutamate epimerase-like enolase superfamily enzyme